MFPKSPSKLLLVLFVVALVCVLVVSGPVHAALHGDSPGDGCNVCHLAITSLPTPVLVPAIADIIRAVESPPQAPIVEAHHAVSISPRAPPRV